MRIWIFTSETAKPLMYRQISLVAETRELAIACLERTFRQMVYGIDWDSPFELEEFDPEQSEIIMTRYYT